MLASPVVLLQPAAVDFALHEAANEAFEAVVPDFAFEVDVPEIAFDAPAAVAVPSPVAADADVGAWADALLDHMEAFDSFFAGEGGAFAFSHPHGVRASLLQSFAAMPAQRVDKAPAERARMTKTTFACARCDRCCCCCCCGHASRTCLR